mmetsp:Transcript_23272/g.30152  ORF Transcript_23272/g.30152 Transcript_23272/m.30152 type:complete len:232 (-) Transcript_23272:917-1612(-)
MENDDKKREVCDEVSLPKKKRRKPVCDAAKSVLAELDKLKEFDDVSKYDDRVWTAKACGERLQTFCSLAWIPGRISNPEQLAREGWRYEKSHVFCDVCKIRCKPQSPKHMPLCLWHSAELPSTIWCQLMKGSQCDFNGWQRRDETSFGCALCAQQIKISTGNDTEENPQQKSHRWFCPWRCDNVVKSLHTSTSTAPFLISNQIEDEGKDDLDKKRSAALRARVAASLALYN